MNTLILGGGLAGLASALLATARGENVTLLERETLGGKSRRIVLQGQTIDTGPALHSFKGVWNALLEKAGEHDPLEHLPWPSLGRHHFRGQSLELPVYPEHPLYPHWKRYLEHQRPIQVESLLTTPPRLTDPHVLCLCAGLARVHGLHFSASSYLGSLELPELLRQSLAIHALNAGIGSSRAPALYASLPALMLESGLSVPRGGIFELTRTLEQMCVERGFNILEHVPVTRVEAGRVWAGERSWTFERLISSLDFGRLEALRGHRVRIPRRRTCSGVAIYSVLEEPLDLPLSSVVLPNDPRALEEDLWNLCEPIQTMAFVNHYPPHGIYPDNTRAVLSVLLTAPANGHHYALESDWVQRQLEWLERVLKRPLRKVMRSSAVFHPQYFQEGGAWGGAIYGVARAPWQAGPFHVPRHRQGREVWQVGTSVHPGGGIPGVLGGALMADELIRGG